jgi:hypothetical protein
MDSAARQRDAGDVTKERHRWLGWPVWVVSALLIVAAVTGTAGPVSVIWALGTISVGVSIAGIYLSGLLGAARRKEQHPGTGKAPQRPDEGSCTPADSTAGQGPGAGTG